MLSGKDFRRAVLRRFTPRRRNNNLLASSVRRAVDYVTERLESRVLLSFPEADVDTLTDRIQRHQLTQTEMNAIGVMDMEWRGRTSYVKRNEWVVDLDRGVDASSVLNGLGFGGREGDAIPSTAARTSPARPRVKPSSPSSPADVAVLA